MARWYIIHAYSGFENKVRDAIIAEAERLGLSEAVEDVQVPTETVTEVKRGKKVQVERKFMAGYVLAKLKLTDDVYHLVKNTPKVTGFLGNNNKPQAISEREASSACWAAIRCGWRGPRLASSALSCALVAAYCLRSSDSASQSVPMCCSVADRNFRQRTARRFRTVYQSADR